MSSYLPPWGDRDDIVVRINDSHDFVSGPHNDTTGQHDTGGRWLCQPNSVSGRDCRTGEGLDRKNNMASNALAIFAKAPAVGEVKTRLCPPLSPTEAAELARCFLVDIVERACTLVDVQVSLAITPAESEPAFRVLLPFPVQYIPQRGKSLGEREVNVFVDLLSQGFSSVVLIGSDIPTLPLVHLRTAFTQLQDPRFDAVLGPSQDGGYYLVGMRAVHRELFENITWSTPQVLAQTLAQARRHHLHVSLVPSWYDVDTVEDLQRLAADLRQNRGGEDAPRTRAYLTRLGWCPANGEEALS